MIYHQVTNSYGNFNYNAYVYTGFFFGPHFHGNYELIYVMGGSTEISINGSYDTLEQGELILISPYTIHTISVPDSSKAWVGVFSEDFVPTFAQKNKFTRFSKFRCDDNIEDILKQYLFYQGHPEHYLHIACLHMVCGECVKNSVAYSSRQENELMYRVIDYINQNIGENITLKDMAQALNYEYHYFSSLFHQFFCMNFKGFINIFRFEAACKLLSGKNESVTEVCSKCGFGSIRNFNRVFKQLSGITPGEYKKLT